jgi:hypothetical protein
VRYRGSRGSKYMEYICRLWRGVVVMTKVVYRMHPHPRPRIHTHPRLPRSLHLLHPLTGLHSRAAIGIALVACRVSLVDCHLPFVACRLLA